MAYNAKAIQALVESGGDAMNNIFDVIITFPAAIAASENMQQQARVRLKGEVSIPEPATQTYEIGYHGVAINRPKTTMDLERKLTLTFRLDASYRLHQTFILWHNLVTDPNLGSFADSIDSSAQGSIVIRQLAGEFMAPGANGMVGLLDTDASVKQDNVVTPEWSFKGVWVGKVSQPKFSAGKDATEQDYTVDFYFDDIAYPFYTGYGTHP